jgi:hypothetical protein
VKTSGENSKAGMVRKRNRTPDSEVVVEVRLGGFVSLVMIQNKCVDNFGR